MIVKIIEAILNNPNVRPIFEAVAEDIRSRVPKKETWKEVWCKYEKYEDKQYITVVFFSEEKGVALTKTGELIEYVYAEENLFFHNWVKYFDVPILQQLYQNDVYGQVVEWGINLHNIYFNKFKEHVDNQQKQTNT